MRSRTEIDLWMLLLASGGALLFPDIVAEEAFFVNRRTIRLLAAPLFLASIVLLTDGYYHWSRGLI